MSNPQPATGWTIQDSRTLYNIDRWGAAYYNINEEGNVVAQPLHESGATVALNEVIAEARERNLQFPVLIRFQDILRHRVKALNEAFQHAIKEFHYQGHYRGVFPIKVNQLREVVEEILDAGTPWKFGLEVGSKPELYAGLSLQNEEDSLIICNGYKDEEFIRTALLGTKLGKKVIMVVEKLSELKQIIAISKSMNVEPAVGVRARLQSKGAGKWAESGGENAKFGLSTIELIAATKLLKRENLTQCLKLLHFHIGSQVPDVQIIKKAVLEAARFYAKLYKMGFEIQFFDVGGGLGVDYDGSRTAFESSTNYTLQEYTNDIVFQLGEVCDAEAVPHPTIVSESGRALVAHHSVLVVEVFGSIERMHGSDVLDFEGEQHPMVADLLEVRSKLDGPRKREAYHDARQRREEAETMFALGMMELEDKAKIESLYWDISHRLVREFRDKEYIPEEIRELEDSLGDQFLCNFSVFQSLIDHWALGQLFPIMPLTRLNEKPTHDGTLADITCDSDGQIKKFIDLEDVRGTLPMHAFKENGGDREPYYLGFFLMGAYQDVMGDLHNLFGRVNEIHVFLDPDEPSGYYVEEIIEGTTIAQALTSVQYDENELKRRMKMQIDAAIKSDRLKPSEGMRLLGDYERGLKNTTYLKI